MSARQSAMRLWIAALFATLALAGCARGLGELEQGVEEIKARKGAPLEPLPIMRTFETFEYTAQGNRDPFSPSAEEQVVGSEAGPRPDANRAREELENFPLDALDMVGTLGLGADQTGLLKDPDGVIHQVRADNYLGQNFGRITTISEGQIELVELIPNGVGGWIERQASISLDAK